jgi:hypothetical protein
LNHLLNLMNQILLFYYLLNLFFHEELLSKMMRKSYNAKIIQELIFVICHSTKFVTKINLSFLKNFFFLIA